MNIYTDRFFTLSPYLLGVMGFDGYFKHLNPVWEKTLGWTVAELQARPYLEFVHPEDRAAFIDTAHQLMAGGATTSVQSRYLCQDGSSKWLSWHLTAFPEEQLIYTIAHDISQHKQVMDTLRDNRDHFWLLAENLQDFIYRYRFSPGRGFEYVSPTITLITGYTPEEYYTDPDLYFKIIHPDDRPQLERYFQEKSINGQPLTLRWVRKDGTIIWIEQRNVPIFDQAGYLMIVEGIARNITKRKQVEEALQESNCQLEIRDRFISRILENIPISLVVIDRSLHLVSANRNFLEKTRREAAATLGRRLQEVFPPVLLEYTRLEWRVQQVFHTGQPMEGGKVAYRAAGLSPRIYYYRLIPLKAEESVENVMLLLDDITDREQLGEEVRRAERHLASVVECANDLVISLDAQGRIVTWNQAAERISGLKTEEVQGQTLLSFCATSHWSVMAEMLQRLARGENIHNIEVNLLTANAREVPITWSCSPMLNDTGHTVGIVAVGRDLTDYRRLEAQLIQSAKMASLGVIAGGIAHELRNPLGIIAAGAQLLMERPDDAQLRSQCAQKIQAATQRASLIIENLLKFARPQGSLQMGEVNSQAVLEETLAMLAHQLLLQQVTLRQEFQPDLPPVHGNAELLQQVFTNLTLNACNAMPQGGTLTITGRTTEADQVELQFADMGYGIPPENLSRVFDPFFTTLPVGQGTGLGLSISYGIIQQHLGTIEVESQVGRGTTFTIRLQRVGK